MGGFRKQMKVPEGVRRKGTQMVSEVRCTECRKLIPPDHRAGEPCKCGGTYEWVTVAKLVEPKKNGKSS